MLLRRTADTERPASGLVVDRRRAVWLLVAIGIAAATAQVVDEGGSDTVTDLDHAARSLWRPLSEIDAPVLGVLLIVAMLHYVASACAARAAAGRPMPVPELTAAQLAAAAANRFAPAGLGAAAVLGRFFVRRAGLPPAGATAAVVSLSVLGALADLAAFAVLVGLATLLHVPGAGHYVSALVSRLAHIVPISPAWWPVAVAVVATATLLVLRLRKRRRLQRVTAVYRSMRIQLADLLSSPGRVAALCTASASTTLLLAAGFAAAAILGPADLPGATIGSLMIGYMIGNVAGNAIPVPGGIGTTEVTLAAVLTVPGASTTTAVATVVAFRLVTFWLPAVVGLGAAQWLRRRGAL